MTCCLDPACQNPPHLDGIEYCSSCGAPLIALRNRYRPIQSIGGGGFGKTYLAEDIDKLNEPCVIKQFAPQVQGTGALKKATELFEQEAKRLQQLGKHPQIPTLLAYFNEDKRLYLVQEFIEGQNLLKELQQDGHFTENKVRELLLDLLDILKTVHQQKVIHRDIKPENIIRHSNGKLVLIDFGASKQLTATAVTQAGTQIGSFGYAPMEQMQGGEAFPSSDLYSVGATCFHLLSGTHPWELWKRQGYGWVFSWRNHLRQGVSQEFGRMLDKLLQEESHHRYESVEELLKDLNPPPQPSITKIQQDFADLPPTQLPIHQQLISFSSSSSPALVSSQDQVLTKEKLVERLVNSEVSPQPSRQYTKLAKHLLLGVAITLVGIQIYGYTRDRLFPPSPIIANVSELASQSKANKIFLENVLQGYSNYNPFIPIAISPDGKTLASGSGDKNSNIKLWDIDKGKEIFTHPGHSEAVRSLAFSSDGKILASGSEEKNSNIKLWDISTGKEILTLPGHSEAVRSVAFSPDGKILASGSEEKNSNIKLWDIDKGKEILTLPGHSISVRSVAFSPDGKILASGSGERNSNINNIKLWDIAIGKEILTLPGHSKSVRSVAFSSDGKILASGSNDTTIKLWDIAKGKLINTLKGHEAEVNSVAISPDGKTLVSGSHDKTIKVWDIATREEILNLEDDYGVNSVAISPDGKTLARGSMDKTVKVWRLP
ncbi:serine/threonine-protein kinase [Nostoc sp. PCC 7107]|uniref:serine/threonine-protein kinase n=1 Tax=Nostoc sp. PCC 7107 TaxID=317936 RepID=UPI00029EFFAD|nr:serine/threonine-protein kinase [Nostoc sp. PCC 7107]AFY44576.1 serine/threonine protein kinase with WD40 repeats [Nostoc sp. PCC 7107]